MKTNIGYNKTHQRELKNEATVRGGNYKCTSTRDLRPEKGRSYNTGALKEYEVRVRAVDGKRYNRKGN